MKPHQVVDGLAEALGGAQREFKYVSVVRANNHLTTIKISRSSTSTQICTTVDIGNFTRTYRAGDLQTSIRRTIEGLRTTFREHLETRIEKSKKDKEIDQERVAEGYSPNRYIEQSIQYDEVRTKNLDAIISYLEGFNAKSNVV